MRPLPPPLPGGTSTDDQPHMVIRRVGTKERGFMAWEAWVEVGTKRYFAEYGTYAWTRKGAERKAARLLKRYLESRPGPIIRLD